MAEFLTEQWFAMAGEEGAKLPPMTGVSANLMLEIAGAPSGKLRATAVVADGQITQLEIGKNADAECTVVAPAEFAAAILRGEEDPEVAYMRGDVKLADAYEKVLFELRPLTGSPEWAEFVERVSANTEF